LSSRIHVCLAFEQNRFTLGHVAWLTWAGLRIGTANAFVLPGGKVFVFSGILPLASNDSALAAVLGHEIAHNVADHVGERMSQSIGTNIVLYSAMALVGFLGFGPMLMHFVGSRFLDVTFGNPMSRLQESEADYIGLMMMSEACYDPSEAIQFWARMEAAKKEQEIPEWLSTHPSVGRLAGAKLGLEWFTDDLDRMLHGFKRSKSGFLRPWRRGTTATAKAQWPLLTCLDVLCLRESLLCKGVIA